MPNPKMNLWLQRLSVAAMVALAIALVAVGVAIYGTPAAAELTQVTGVAHR